MLWIIGNLTMDVALTGMADMPTWGTEARATGRETRPGGQALNLAVALSRLGIENRVTSAIGNDADGRLILSALASAGIDPSGIAIHPERSTALTICFVRPDGERAFVSDFGAADLLTDDDAAEATIPVEGDILCIVGQFGLPSLTMSGIKSMFAMARTAGVATVYDPGWDPNGWTRKTVDEIREALSLVDVFLPNEAEAFALSTSTDREAALDDFIGCGVTTAVIKSGDRGSIGQRDHERWAVSALPVVARDAIGAGDVFDAAFIASCIRNGSLPSGRGHLANELARASAAAGIYVSRDADRFPSGQEIDAATAQIGRLTPTAPDVPAGSRSD